MQNEGGVAERFVSRFNRRLAVAVWLGCAGIGVSVLFTPFGPLWNYLLPVLFAATFAWLGLWLPDLSFDDRRIVVRNVFSTLVVPWSELISVDTRFALTLHTPTRRISVWAAPAPGTSSTYRATRVDQRGVDPDAPAGPRAGDLVGTDSGDAAHLVRSHWSRVREGLVARGDRIEVQPHWFGILALAALAAAMIAAAITA